MNQPHQNWFCPRCGHKNQPRWNACQQCRIPNPYMPSIPPQAMKASPKGMVIIFLVFAGFCGMCGLLGLVTDRGSKNTPGVLVSSSPLSASESLTFQEKVKTFSTSENLEKAKTLLKNTPSKEQVYQATIHLQAIPKSAAEYKESQKLFKLSRNLAEKYLQQEIQEAKRQKRELALASKREAMASRSIGNARSSRRASGNYYIRGPRGGCYYINGNGNKTYVDRSLCN